MACIRANDNQSSNALLLESRAAYISLLPEIDSVPDSDLTRINLDVFAVATFALGVVPAIAPFADDAKKLLGFDASCFTKLESYALAASYAHIVRMASLPDDPAALVPRHALIRSQRTFALFVRCYRCYNTVRPSRFSAAKRGTSTRSSHPSTRSDDEPGFTVGSESRAGALARGCSGSHQ